MKNVLMIANVFPPTNHSGTARPYFFARYLPEHDYRPIVLTSHGEKEKYHQDSSVLKTLQSGQSEIVRIDPWLSPDSRLNTPLLRPVYRRLEYRAKWFWPALWAGRKLFRKHPYDLIWATGDPWTSLIAGAWLSKWTRKPLIADFRDPWTYGPGWKPMHKWNERRQKAQERFVIRNAARTVFTSPLTTEIMQKRMPEYADRFVTITNGYFEKDVQPLRKTGETVCLFRFVGNFTNRNKIPILLFEAIEEVCREPQIADRIRFELIGNSADFENELERFSISKQVHFTGSVSFEESRALMRGADVLLIYQMMTGAGKDVISGKSYEYLAAGRPILAIADQQSGDAWLMRKTGAGLVTGVSDSGKIAEGIRHYFRMWSENRLKSPRYHSPIQRFSRKRVTADLAGLFDEVLEKESGS